MGNVGNCPIMGGSAQSRAFYAPSRLMSQKTPSINILRSVRVALSLYPLELLVLSRASMNDGIVKIGLWSCSARCCRSDWMEGKRRTVFFNPSALAIVGKLKLTTHAVGLPTGKLKSD